MSSGCVILRASGIRKKKIFFIQNLASSSCKYEEKFVGSLKMEIFQARERDKGTRTEKKKITES